LCGHSLSCSCSQAVATGSSLFSRLFRLFSGLTVLLRFIRRLKVDCRCSSLFARWDCYGVVILSAPKMSRGSTCLCTLLIRDYRVPILIILDDKTPQHVPCPYAWLPETFGLFEKTFCPRLYKNLGRGLCHSAPRLTPSPPGNAGRVGLFLSRVCFVKSSGDRFSSELVSKN